MSTNLIEQRLKEYVVTSRHEEMNALKEIFQEIALCALARTSFFTIAAFQGGSCLRIVHKLNRFSEDLDFIALEPQQAFTWEPFLKVLEAEFVMHGLVCRVVDKSAADKAVKMAFLKESSFGRVLVLHYPQGPSDKQVLHIKLEIDTNPPAGSQTETQFVDFPYVFSMRTQDLPSLFASKCHALLCRSYTKGRDWFDFIWYVSKNIVPNYEHLQYALDQAGPWQGQGVVVTPAWLLAAVREKLKTIDWHEAQRDAARFLSTHQQATLVGWSYDLFASVTDRLEKNINS